MTGPNQSRRLFHNLSSRERVTYEKVGRAMTEIRLGVPPGRAAREAGTTLEAILRHGYPWATRTPSGTWQLSARDNMVRRLRLPTQAGPVIMVETADSRVATEVGRYWSAMGRFLAGDRDALRPFEGRAVTVGGRQHPFIADPQQVVELARRGEISFESIYASTT